MHGILNEMASRDVILKRPQVKKGRPMNVEVGEEARLTSYQKLCINSRI